ncbi:MAG: glycosyltransferase family 9 protein [Phycisphaerae bacterium]|nr:glycosyltransferase family 9 protein [Phycisphaerae bacterium]
MTLNIAPDCRHYLGDRPCPVGNSCRCRHYAPMGFRVLIIKIGALGDVVRTAALLPTLKRTWPVSHVTWLTSEAGVRILARHPQIDRLLPFDASGTAAVLAQSFDLVISLDKDAGPAGLCRLVRSADKRGITLSEWGTVVPANRECEGYFALGLDNHAKFVQNTRSYPQLIHEALGLEYRGEPYRLQVDPSWAERAERIFQRRPGADGPVIGLNTGAGPNFARKTLSPARWVELARALTARGYAPALLGGPGEIETNAWILEQLGPEVLDTGCRNREDLFAALIDRCDLVITGDSLGLHVAVARGVPTAALFGPTCPQEIELYGLGRKLVSPCACGPCYRRECAREPHCMDAIPLETILEAVETICPTERTAAIPTQPARRVTPTGTS